MLHNCYVKCNRQTDLAANTNQYPRAHLVRAEVGQSPAEPPACAMMSFSQCIVLRKGGAWLIW